jgi:catechol 2,3-dioxygenase-like lactoylglutathione lyase family enzyme
MSIPPSHFSETTMRPIVVAAIIATAVTGLAAAQTPATADVKLQSFSVIVPDYDEAKRWYVEKLGFVVVRDQAFGAGVRFVQVAPAGQTDVGIVLQKARTAPDPREPEMPTDYSDRVGKTVNVVLRTNNVIGYAETLKTRGVTFTSPPRQMPWGAQATFKDLYGNSFVIVGAAGASAGQKGAGTP